MTYNYSAGSAWARKPSFDWGFRGLVGGAVVGSFAAILAGAEGLGLLAESHFFWGSDHLISPGC